MNRDFSLIDANLSRAKEGMRVVEDTIRFVLRNEVLYAKIRPLRHLLAQLEHLLGSATRLTGRDFGQDLGQASLENNLVSRRNFWGLMKANISRLEEALRVLEEYAKIYLPQHYPYFQKLRHDIYRLEFEVLSSTPHYWLQLYFESGIVYPLSDNVDELVWLIDHGAKVVQLRNKSNDKNEIFNQAKFLCEYIDKKDKTAFGYTPVLLIIDDCVEVASQLPVAGVHIGQTDMPFLHARKILGSSKIIGKSNNNLEQMKASVAEGADYVAIGPVFATPIKKDCTPVGIDAIKKIKKEIFIPWVAIGGINKENSSELYSVGANNIAVIRSAKDFFI
ncbi:MAG: thiamine phosphate synthase [Candidatus Magasanikbacteria bacterium]